MDKLKVALGSLKKLVLPDGTPPIEAVPPSIDTAAMADSRARLAGAIGLAADGKWFAFPPGPDKLSAGSKKLCVSDDGVLAQAKDLSETQVAAIGFKEVILNVLTDQTSTGSAAPVVWRAGGLDAVIKTVANASGLKKVAVSLAGQSPAEIACDQLTTVFPAMRQLPWGGSAGGPPPLKLIAGMPDEATALAAALTPATVLGASPAGALRQAQLNVMSVTFDTCDKAGLFVCGLAEETSDMARTTTSGFAALNAAAGAAGSELASAQDLATELSHAFCSYIDSIPAAAVSSTAERVRELTAVGLAPGPRQTGILLAQAVAALPSVISPASVPVPHPPAGAASPAAVASAITAALGSIAPPPDAAAVEATRRLAANRSSLEAAGAYSAVLQGVTAALRAQGFGAAATPSATASATAPTAAAAAAAAGSAHPPAPAPVVAPTFPYLRPVGSESAPTRTVVQQIAAAFGRSELELVTMLASTVERPATDPFFASDAEHEAELAAADYGRVVAHTSTSQIIESFMTAFSSQPPFGAAASPPPDWHAAGHRLRAIVSAYRHPPAAAADAGPSREHVRRSSSDDQRGTQVPKATSTKRSVSASALVIAGLTEPSVIEAERLAVAGRTEAPDPIQEALGSRRGLGLP